MVHIQNIYSTNLFVKSYKQTVDVWNFRLLSAKAMWVGPINAQPRYSIEPKVAEPS